jgi:carbonic anhydrase
LFFIENRWFLSHVDIHTPSEHSQEGKQYDAELQMHHFYSVKMETNEVSTVAIFLQAYETAQPFRILDKLICLWRHYEQTTRSACNLSPVTDPYPGCFPIPRRLLKRREVEQNKTKTKSPFPTVIDWILAKDRLDQARQVNPSANTTTKFPNLVMDDVNFEDAEMDDEQWAAFIAQESARFQSEEGMWKEVRREWNDTAQAHEAFHQRQLLAGNELDWFNYFAMLGVRTEYYFRYVGSQTIPPCYGNVEKDSRRGSNHWRVMKDPIRVHPRQIHEMKRLIRERIAPKDDPVMACQPDTAAKVRSDGTVDTARPLQSTNPAHYDVFCECKDWPSKWPEDREWCRNKNATSRFYDQPYNFEGSEF